MLDEKEHPPPPELAEIWLCQMYSCTPSELDEQDAERINGHVIALNEYRKQKEMERNRGK